MRWALVLLAITGCKRNTEEQVAPLGSAAAAPAPALATTGLAAATRVSRTPDHWPCATVGKTSEGTDAITRFTYGERKSCNIPHSLFTTTFEGCPSAIDHDGVPGNAGHIVPTYDEHGNVLAVGGSRYTWGSSGPISRETSGVETFTIRGRQIALVDDLGAGETYTFDAGGFLTNIEATNAAGTVVSRFSIQYDASQRPDRVLYRNEYEKRDSAPTQLYYDCTHLPPPPPPR